MLNKLDNMFDFETNQTQIDKAKSGLLNCIAHDVTNQLATMLLRLELLDQTLPNLLEVYLSKKDNLSVDKKIRENYVLTLENDFIGDFKKQVKQTINFLSAMISYEKQLDNFDYLEELSAKKCISEMLNNHAFDNEEDKKLINFNSNHDFKFKELPIPIEFLLSNLLENAISSIKRANKGEINIWLSAEKNYHLLHFKDSGIGMDEKNLTHVFDRFFSKSQNEIVPGLGFYKLALLKFDGDLICESKKNEYAHFIIRFPR